MRCSLFASPADRCFRHAVLPMGVIISRSTSLLRRVSTSVPRNDESKWTATNTATQLLKNVVSDPYFQVMGTLSAGFLFLLGTARNEMRTDFQNLTMTVNNLAIRNDNIIKDSHDKILAVVAAMDTQLQSLRTKMDTDNKELKTKMDTDNKELKTQMDTDHKQLNTKIEDVRKELNTKMEDDRNELNTKMEDVRKELNTKMEDDRNELNTKMEDVRKELSADHKELMYALLALATGRPAASTTGRMLATSPKDH